MNLGERVKKLRKRLSLTQKKFAQRIDGKVDYTYIGMIERNKQYPSLKMLERIGKAYSVPMSYFFEDEAETVEEEQRRRQDMARASKVIMCLICHFDWESAQFTLCKRCQLDLHLFCDRLKRAILA